MSDMGIWTKPRRTLPRKDVKGLERRNYAYRTAKTYVRIVREFAEHFQQPPDKRGPEQIQHIGPICSRPRSYRLPRSASTFQRYVSCLSSGREMAANGVQSEEECAVGHEHENRIQAPRANNGVSANGNNALKAVSQSRNSPEIEAALVQELDRTQEKSSN